VLLRELLRRAAARVGHVQLDQLSSELFETALLSDGELTTSHASVRGLETLADFRTAAVDADHFEITSSLQSLNCSMTVDAHARLTALGWFRSEQMQARFAAVSQMKAVRVTAIWSCPLTPAVLRTVLGVADEVSVEKAQRQLNARIVSVRVEIGNAVVSLQSTEPRPEDLGSASLLWRLVSSACATQLKKALEEKLATKLLEAVRDIERQLLRGGDPT